MMTIRNSKLVLLGLFSFFGLKAQVDPDLLLGLTHATTAEMSSLTGLPEGLLLYNTDTQGLFVFNGSDWAVPTPSSWLFAGNAPSAGSFIGTTNDVLLDLRSNNTSILQAGRRQTLGLVQSYTDYDDPDQYLTHIMGDNGVSALQFQADQASFYKPMLFTTSDGNFRLKGSAAGTDFFEIGSTGTSNDGEVEFIIADDGDEPFTFKRYDYRDQLLKELMRIQGSADAQDAKPRVGIATGAMANSTLQVNGSMALSVITPTVNITLDESHFMVLLNSNISVTLPVASTAAGRIYVIKNATTAARTISTYVDSAGNNSTQVEASSIVWLQSDGTNWNSLSTIDQVIITNLTQNTVDGTITYVNENNSSQTANVISADTNNSIGVGSDGGAYLKINFGGRWTNTNTTTNLNVNNTIAPIFGTEDYKDDGNNLYEVIGNTLEVKEAGRYQIMANLSLLGINSTGSTEARTNVNARIAVNGTAVGARGSSAYIRFASGHAQSSLHLNEILELSEDDVITVVTFREANSGTVRFNASGESSFSINKLR